MAKIEMARDHVNAAGDKMEQGKTYEVTQAVAASLLYAGAATPASANARKNTPQSVATENKEK